MAASVDAQETADAFCEIASDECAVGTAATAATAAGAANKPTSKITIYADIPSLNIKKSIRLLPTQNLESFLTKLQRKRIIRGAPASFTIMLRKRDSADKATQLPAIPNTLDLWDLGVRDQASFGVPLRSILGLADHHV